MPKKPALVIYISANLIGFLLFLVSVSAICHTAKMEQRDYYDFGDSLNFILTGLPVFLLCLLFNIAWGLKALIDVFHHRNYQAAMASVVLVAVWVATILIVRMIT